MVKCPACNADIDHLNVIVVERSSYRVFLGDGEPFEYHHKDVCSFDVENDAYHCPDCDVLLVTDEENAVKFLKGELPLCTVCHKITGLAAEEVVNGELSQVACRCMCPVCMTLSDSDPNLAAHGQCGACQYEDDLRERAYRPGLLVRARWFDDPVCYEGVVTESDDGRLGIMCRLADAVVFGFLDEAHNVEILGAPAELPRCTVCGKPAEGDDVCACLCPRCGVHCFDDVTISDHGMCLDCHKAWQVGGLDDQRQVVAPDPA